MRISIGRSPGPLGRFAKVEPQVEPESKRFHRTSGSNQSANRNGLVERPSRLQIRRTGLAPCRRKTLGNLRADQAANTIILIFLRDLEQWRPLSRRASPTLTWGVMAPFCGMIVALTCGHLMPLEHWRTLLPAERSVPPFHSAASSDRGHSVHQCGRFSEVRRNRSGQPINQARES